MINALTEIKAAAAVAMMMIIMIVVPDLPIITKKEADPLTEG